MVKNPRNVEQPGAQRGALQAITAALAHLGQVLEGQDDPEAAAPGLLACVREALQCGGAALMLEPHDAPPVALADPPSFAWLAAPGEGHPLEVLKRNAAHRDRPQFRNDLPQPPAGRQPASPLPHNALYAPLTGRGARAGLLALADRSGGFDEGATRLATILGNLSVALLEHRADPARMENERQRFRSVVESAFDAIVTLDPEARIVYSNRAARRLFGYSGPELLGLPISRLLPSLDHGDPPQEGPRNQTSTPRTTARVMEYLARRKNGEEFPVGLTMSSWHVGPQVFFTAILRDLTEHKAAAERVQATLKRLRAAMDGVVQAMALTVERRAPYTAGHQRRVANLARAIGQRLGLSPNQIDGIRVAGVIHDLGKIAIPAEILSKPGRLNDYELGLMRTHPEVGYEILSGVDFAWPVAEIVRQHHERWDGSGYPRGLSGEGILPEARILAVADVVEAVSSYRPYRPALGLEAALEELAKGRGTAFEPQVVDACLDVFRKGFRLEPGVREQPEH